MPEEGHWHENYPKEEETAAAREHCMASQPPPVPRRKQQRSKLLHTCGVSFLTLAHKAYQRVEQIHGPIGFLSQKLSSLTTPILHPMQHLWLSILSFADEQIMAVENLAVFAFPASANMLDKIDHHVEVLSEALPSKFDYAMDHFPAIVGRVPLLGWALAEAVEVVKFFVSVLTDWTAVEERVIRVDARCNELPDEESSDGIQGQGDLNNVFDEKSVRDAGKADVTWEAVKGALRGMGADERERMEEERSDGRSSEISAVTADEEADEREEVAGAEVPILELFEEGWHKKKQKPRKRRN